MIATWWGGQMRQMDKVGFRTGKYFFFLVLVIDASNLR